MLGHRLKLKQEREQEARRQREAQEPEQAQPRQVPATATGVSTVASQQEVSIYCPNQPSHFGVLSNLTSFDCSKYQAPIEDDDAVEKHNERLVERGDDDVQGLQETVSVLQETLA